MSIRKSVSHRGRSEEVLQLGITLSILDVGLMMLLVRFVDPWVLEPPLVRL